MSRPDIANFEIAAAGKFGHAGIKARSEGGVDLLCRLGLERGGLPRLAVVENVAGTTAKIAGYLDWVGSWLSGLHGTRPSPQDVPTMRRARARDVEIHTKTRP